MKRTFVPLLLGLFILALAPAPALAATPDEFGLQGKAAPFFVPMDQAEVTIAGVLFVDEVQGVDGNRMKVPAKSADKFRYALVTIRIKKPAGAKLTIASADLTLHYYHGNEPEVAPCEGISTFSTSADSERPMKLPQMQGPGWLKQTTGARAAEATEVFVDAVFAMIEPEIKEVWVGISQPSTRAAFISKGWQGGGGGGKDE